VKILYIDAGNDLYENAMYTYYGDLRRELEKLSDIHHYITLGPPPIAEIFAKESFDAVVFGIGYFALQTRGCYNLIPGLKDLDIPVVGLLHKPQTLLEEKLNFFKINNFDILGDPHITYKEYAAKAGAQPLRSWFTATPKLFYPRYIEKKYDIGFSGALHGSGKISGATRDIRTRAYEILSRRDDLNIFWNGSDSVSTRISSTEEYATRISESKMWLSTTGPALDVGTRYFEVALSKTLLFCNHMPDQYADVFIDGQTCVTFNNDLTNFEEKLDHYIANPSESQTIIDNAYEKVFNHYTWKHMALNLLKEVENVRK
jgi:hypothetical protein